MRQLPISLLQYFENHSFLCHDQSAFRKGHSTRTAFHKLVEDLLDNINGGMMNAICFLDLKKCVDTINLDLLLLKLQKYGVENNELLWFTDYLSDRSQAVTVDGCISSFTIIHVCGTDLKEIQKRLQEEVYKVVKWFIMDRLLINNQKCCCMIIATCPSQ